MAIKNLHESPFDDATIAKLSIFEDYAQAWLPVFIMQGKPKICIFDFFAGTGYDKQGVEGSSVRLLKKIKEQAHHANEKGVEVVVFLNEYDINKFQQLKHACEEFLLANPDIAKISKVNYYNEDFEKLFPRLLPEIKKYPSLVYLDQNGIKFLKAEYIWALEKTQQTDFLYFVASSYFNRFGNVKEFKQHFTVDMEEISKAPYEFIHRVLLNQIKTFRPAESELKLYPFSLKKGSNIYGIVFGAKHIRAVDKFLEVAWRKDPICGEANFDINQESQKAQGSLFGDRLLTKIESFEQTLREKILTAELRNNIEVYIFTLEQGHLGKHAADVLRSMKKENKIRYDATSPLVNYQSAYGRDKRLLDYEVVQNNETY